MLLRRLDVFRIVLSAGLYFASGSLACSQRAEDEGPERTVQEFIDRMRGVHGDPQKARAAYELLARAAQANLEERAERASAAAGRVVKPEEMIAPSRFFLNFEPQKWSTEQGQSWAIVTAEGDAPGERSQVRCVREQGHWRVLLELPELPPIERR